MSAIPKTYETIYDYHYVAHMHSMSNYIPPSVDQMLRGNIYLPQQF